jgi:hypothetical protein
VRRTSIGGSDRPDTSGFWRYYWYLLRGAPRAAAKAANNATLGVASVGLVIALFNRPLARDVTGWRGVSPLWAVTPFLVWFAYGLLRINYGNIVDLATQRDSLQVTLDAQERSESASLPDQLETMITEGEAVLARCGDPTLGRTEAADAKAGWDGRVASLLSAHSPRHSKVYHEHIYWFDLDDGVRRLARGISESPTPAQARELVALDIECRLAVMRDIAVRLRARDGENLGVSTTTRALLLELLLDARWWWDVNDPSDDESLRAWYERLRALIVAALAPDDAKRVVADLDAGMPSRENTSVGPHGGMDGGYQALISQWDDRIRKLSDGRDELAIRSDFDALDWANLWTTGTYPKTPSTARYADARPGSSQE